MQIELFSRTFFVVSVYYREVSPRSFFFPRAHAANAASSRLCLVVVAVVATGVVVNKMDAAEAGVLIVRYLE